MFDALTILRKLADPVSVIGPEGELLFFNNASSALTEFGVGEMAIGKNIADVCIPGYRNEIIETIRFVRNYKEPRDLDMHVTNARGEILHLRVTFSPVPGDEKRKDSIFIIARDITEQKIFESKASEMAHLFNDLTENANAIIFSTDAQFYITSWNSECARLTGFQAKDILAKSVRYFVKDPFLKSLERLRDDVMSGQPVQNFEVEIFTVDERGITLMLNATPWRNREGKVVGILFVGQDITELSEYRQSLEKKVHDRTRQLIEALRKEKQLVEIKKRFVSIASHEFRVPLGAIHSTVQRLEASDHLQQHERESLRGIDGHVRHMRSLLDDVLTLERTGIKQLESERKEADLIAILESIAAEVSAATNNTHEIMRQYDRSSIMLVTDPMLLRNIFINLFSNAIKFSPGKQAIYVRVRVLNTSVVVSVRDEGIGIAEKDQERVFEAFVRGTNTNEIPGTGLGLSIVRKAANALGAVVEVKSKPGEGTTFIVSFPN